MTFQPDRPILISLQLPPDQPFLLEGLDTVLRLGWLTDTQVRHLCQANLVCTLAQATTTAETRGKKASPLSDKDPVLAGAITDFLTEERESAIAPKKSVVSAGAVISGMVRSLLANFSVMWLLLLGVFLVLVSSIVLAAILWKDFPPEGQYSILLGYTLAFWGAGLWTGQQTNLQLTSRMLQIASLLLVPINFWTMDGFRLWSQLPGMGLAAIAAVLLTGITYLLLKPIGLAITEGNSSLLIFNSIALSWLQWGWSRQGLPLLATYIGTVGTVCLQLYLFDGRQERGIRSQETEIESDVESSSSPPSSLPLSMSPRLPLTASPPPLSLISIAISLLLLVTRAVFVKQVPINQMGLALGISGWLLCWLARRDPAHKSWLRAGAVLLLLAWWLAVPEKLPWQAIALSGLGMSLLAERVWQLARRIDLTALFLVGLQTGWLIQQCLPVEWRIFLVSRVTLWVGEDGMPNALLGVSVFPYVIFTLLLAFAFRRWRQPNLALHAESLALILGVLLTSVSLANGGVRSLNLLLSTAAFVWALRDRPAAPGWLIYLTHATGLLAIFSGINFLCPGLTLTLWAAILLGGMLAEWALSAFAPSTAAVSIWRQSAWYAGLVLAACSYILLWNAFLLHKTAWVAIWLVTPSALTLLAYLPRVRAPQAAAGCSIGALVLVQALTFDSEPFRLVSLGLATGLMLLNTYRLSTWVAAFLTLGFGLVLGSVVIFEHNLMELGLNLAAIAAALLWLLRSWLAHRNTQLAKQYAQAADSWAIIISLLLLLFLTIYWILIFFTGMATWVYASTTAFLFVALAYRHWQSPHPLNLYSLVLNLELLVASAVALTVRSFDALGIANLVLALITQLVGDWWLVHHPNYFSPVVLSSSSSSSPPSLTSLPHPTTSAFPSVRIPLSNHFPAIHLLFIPLLYALIGLLIQHQEPTGYTSFFPDGYGPSGDTEHPALKAYTGLCTLAAALVGIGVSRRDRKFKPLTYLSVFIASFGTYELLIYQLSQAKGGSAGDGIVLLAILAAAIAIVERLLSPWLVIYWRLEKREIATIAHLHWLIGNGFLLLAIVNPLSDQGRWCWLVMVALLSVYALVHGRTRSQDVSDASPQLSDSSDSAALWTYAGIWEYLIAFTYFLHLLLADRWLLEWGSAIACVVAWLMYSLPWRTLGWSPIPWKQSALLLPAIVLAVTVQSIVIPGLFLLAAFYAWGARRSDQIRLSYLSVLLADWAIIRLMLQYKVTEPLYFSTVLGCSLLYVVQIDPDLRPSTEREKRHWLRCLAVGLICMTALYQSANSLIFSLVVLSLSIALIIAGLALQIRAFLYLGTATFLIKLLWQVWSYVNQYSQLIWAIGILIGLGFIWVAATFESRRTQVGVLVQSWLDELREWE
ncbi:MAG: hypothetical protein KME16_13385 [Scytolyngbya sp. HA4215-MV1]|nr:hypothetical protein [Scytolyngbya sp. HA4215-MV1]